MRQGSIGRSGSVMLRELRMRREGRGRDRRRYRRLLGSWRRRRGRFSVSDFRNINFLWVISIIFFILGG